MNTYTYKIIQMIRDQNGVVNQVAFDILVSDGIDSTIRHFNTALLPPSGPVIPFTQLTESLVIGWVKSLVGSESEKSADEELAAFKLSKQPINGLPW